MTCRNMGSEGTAPPFLTSELDGDEWSASRSGRFILRKEAPIPIRQEEAWAPELYRLSYPGSHR
jgi:hypothetical protein